MVPLPTGRPFARRSAGVMKFEVSSIIPSTRPLRASRLLHEIIAEDEVLEAAWNQVEKSSAEIVEWFNEPQRQIVESELQGQIDDVPAFVADLRQSVHQIEQWAEFQSVRASLDSLGFTDTVSFCVDNSIARECLVESIERAMLAAWIERCSRPTTAADRSRPTSVTALVDEYRQLDRLLVEQARQGHPAANELRPVMVGGSFAIIRRRPRRRYAPSDQGSARRRRGGRPGAEALLHDEPAQRQPVPSRLPSFRRRDLRRGLPGASR